MSRLLLLLAHSGLLLQSCGIIYSRLQNLAVLMTFLNRDSKVIYLPLEVFTEPPVSSSRHLCLAAVLSEFTWCLKYFYCIVLYCNNRVLRTPSLGPAYINESCEQSHIQRNHSLIWRRSRICTNIRCKRFCWSAPDTVWATTCSSFKAFDVHCSFRWCL